MSENDGHLKGSPEKPEYTLKQKMNLEAHTMLGVLIAVKDSSNGTEATYVNGVITGIKILQRAVLRMGIDE